MQDAKNTQVSDTDRYNNIKLSTNLEENITILKQIFTSDETIIFRKFESMNNDRIKCCAIYIDAMIHKELMEQHIIKPIILSNFAEDNCKDILKVIEHKVIFSGEIKRTGIISDIIDGILYGNTVLLLNESNEVLIINTIEWKTRGIEEPVSENVVRGPREGFNESIDTNISLIRRKIISPDLKFVYKQIGTRTKTRVCICYLEGVALEPIIKEVMKRLDEINIDGILESGYIEELIRDEPLLPFKTIGSTERPDVVASKLLEGRVAVLCDGTPEALTMPYILMEAFQANEDYYNNYIIASVNRFFRYIAFIITTSVPALYVALINFNQELIPTQLLISISIARQGVPFPTVVETLLMIITFEILREAGTRIPKPIGSAVSIVGALVLGDAAVNARIISAPVVIVTALTGISAFLNPKLLAVFIIRIIFVLFASLLGLYGYMFSVIALGLVFVDMRSFGIPYMLNIGIGPLTGENLKDTAIRAPWWLMNTRPRIIAKNLKRQNNNR